MTLPRFRSGAPSLVHFKYREAHHEAALRSLRPALHGVYQLTLKLPQFPLEVLLRGMGEGVAVALCEGAGRVITHTNSIAASQGVRPGVSLRAAQAFCPELAGLGRNPAAEQEALADLTRLLALGRHHVECVPAAPDAWACPDPLTLRVSGFFQPGQGGEPGTVLKRDLRALGYRATVAASTPLPPATLRAQPVHPSHESGTVPAGDEWCSHLHLPWALTRPHEINFALQRMEADLGLALQASGREVDWLQVCLVSDRGGRVHHGIEHVAAGTWKRAMSDLRARVYREPGLGVTAMEIRAGLGVSLRSSGLRARAGLQ